VLADVHGGLDVLAHEPEGGAEDGFVVAIFRAAGFFEEVAGDLLGEELIDRGDRH